VSAVGAEQLFFIVLYMSLIISYIITFIRCESLSALGDVIAALTDARGREIMICVEYFMMFVC
jgi:hypothetical protein